MSSAPLDAELLSALQAYQRTYGWPTSEEQQRGLLQTLLRLTLQANAISLEQTQATELVERLLAAGQNPATLAEAVVSEAQQVVIEQAHAWQVALKTQVKGVLAAYLQRYAPDLDQTALQDIALSVIPLVADKAITKDEVTGILGQVVDSLDVKTMLGIEVNPALEGVVKSLVKVLSQKSLEQAVSETVTAYVKQAAPNLEAVGENLIEQALRAVLNNSVEFDLDTDLRLVDRQLLIDQISFKLNLMKQSPLPSKSAQRMAAELSKEIQRLKQQREAGLGTGDSTQGRLSEDGLSISGWTSTRPPGEAKPRKPSSLDP